MIKAIYRNKVQITKFVLTGGLCAIIEIILMKFLSSPNILPTYFNFENTKYDYPLSNFIATGAAIILNYYLSILWVFDQGKHSKRREFFYFMLLSFLTLILSWRVFAFFQNYITQPLDFGFYHMGPIVFCKSLAIAIVSIVNYIIKKKVVFNG